ncbi:LysR family transcriptional regulator [Vibrio parahaemolyticus]|uniref:LysR family transcriptional regulator n=1 Tax=Vibrio parahaemolyticus TaxID=670 RepID=UPI001F2FB500|nr:LysR family transcriptional regulator [Vibrio parahaemolyticus]MDF4564133.1 LysR family transcriptional regulator [Vibrio parahaemolyticus]MDF5381723.1 LysR family transcriptional regulator [Vibrio parahaemolyticus]MDG2937322.1 LysR family transcriptional regulator [Vibrio parahaemolyticus]UJW93180.1 LysR family transcriptional regulator [Vibrio parahaemolyticus]HBB9943789.1 LysR family transcriptional regulator [Vibrio parahaemolyticus]
MFTIEQLQALVATSESGSFSAAARKLGRAQSVISQHIMNMELDCGVDLFDRSGRYPKLTENGHALMPYAQAAISQLDRLNNKATQLFSAQASELVLAIDEGIPLTRLPDVLKNLEQQFPQLQVECLTASSPDIIELVKSERATTGIILSDLQMPRHIDFTNLGNIAFDVYVSSDHPLAAQRITHIDQLKQYRQLVIRSKSAEPGSLNQALSPDIWYADNYYILLELANKGFGWCFLPEHLVADSPNTLKKVGDDFTKLAWQVNVDLIQHQKWHSDPLHQQAKAELITLFEQTIK